MLRKLNHPQIPKLYDMFDVRGIPHLVMEYILKGIRSKRLFSRKKQTFGEKEAFFLLADVLAIVQHIHAHEIVHRDLRIPNLVFRDGVVYVIDFGLARFFMNKMDRF
ncbi:protein kinase domain-containing protein [Geobacillus vulcani]|uniref:protein kinase domain-containing protein n=1 Tax=Geobacillus vulcani TaxID=135517 RepID=UPI001ED9AC04|nr:protein kinase [Geobacillus vulcani]